jgi:hypothetical protein
MFTQFAERGLSLPASDFIKGMLGYLSYKLIDSNQDWKAKWFYVTNHHPELPKPRGK